MKKNVIRLTATLILTGILLFFFLRSVDWNTVWVNLTQMNLVYFFLFVAVIPLHLITRSLRWKYLLESEKKGIGFYPRFAANAIGFTVVALVPARIGELVRPLYLAQKEGLKKGFVVGTVVIERMFDVFTMCFLLGAFLLAKPLYNDIFPISPDVQSRLHYLGLLGIAAAFCILAGSLALYFFKDKTLKMVMFFFKPFPEKLQTKVRIFFDEFIQGLNFFRSFRNFGFYCLYSLIVWLGIILMYWIFLFAFHVQQPFFMLIPYVFLAAVGAAIPTPGMVGGFHFFSKLGLVSLFAIEANQAIGMTIVVHGMQIIITCVIGFIVIWKEGLSFFQVKKIGSES